MGSILNQSVMPNGRPPTAFPATNIKAKGSTGPQNLPVAVPVLHASNSLDASPLKPSCSTLSSVASGGGPSWLLYRDSDLGASMESNGVVFSNSSTLLSRRRHLQHNLLHGETDQVDVQESAAAPNFFQSLLGNNNNNNKLNPIRNAMEELQLFSTSEPIAALSVTVSSAVKLERRQIDQITKKMQRLTGFKNIMLENTVDPSLIAGFVIHYDRDDSHAIDLSVKGQLAELAARIESSEQRRAEQEHNWRFPN